MFPFDRPASYSEMLNKIGIFTFLSALALTILVAYFVPSVSTLLNSDPTTVEIASIKIPLLYVVPPAILALLARIIRLHDKISDLFGLRARFDLYRIMIPMSGSLQIPVDKDFRDKLLNRRKTAMERTYYAYASFEEPKISKALVLSAIDRWTWYWVLLEFCVLLALTGIVLLAFSAYGGASLVFVVLVLAMLLFSTYYEACGRLADAQIEEIVADADRAKKLATEFTNLRTHA
jgi:hypothetical protein